MYDLHGCDACSDAWLLRSAAARLLSLVFKPSPAKALSMAMPECRWICSNTLKDSAAQARAARASEWQLHQRCWGTYCEEAYAGC